ncbi:hypothetical protein TMatcc_002837 [Talaromyces marneffei ATCC 18224]|uniref:SUN domain-containing protein n=1 Tax=Talaromyces marneffei (strain ATCC 18224 / CBS 334.59 / QM 7333) TaxID=441960 RepID=B6Q7S7_TALMQ|nr:conserved hypothetical protein [Talaromyces marneffei ATCC 18224]KAE8555578.1 hypothetical protein EYB25_000276 [Talaromyces marneffei]
MRRTSQQRDPAYSPSGRRYSLDPSSPVRRSERLGNGSQSSTPSFVLRATTPDARQLHQALRAASESPSKERRDIRARSSIHSSVTPSPPVQRTISSTSTPAAPSLNPAITTDNENLEQQTDRGFSFFRYPRLPSIGFGMKAASIVLSSPQGEDSAFNDNASVISWQLERELHRDNLQRTKPEPEISSYGLGPREGRNIRKPPRRLSGLTWTNDTTHSVDNSNTTNHYDNDVKDDEEEEEEEDKASELSAVRTAPARTVISTNVVRDSADESVANSSRPPTADQPAPVDKPRRPLLFEEQQQQHEKMKETRWPLFLVTMTLFVTIFAITTYFLTGYLGSNDFFPQQPKSPYPTLNATEGNIVSQISKEMTQLANQISVVSRDVHVLRYEYQHGVGQDTIVKPTPDLEPRINFLSPGLGTRVNRKLTSPSVGIRRTLPRRLYEGLTGKGSPQPNPPETALEAWDDIGDCWCGAPSKTGQGQLQLALELGQRAVLNEVVVEHISASASPEPGVAPREMELWAQFKPFHGQQPAKATETETAITNESITKKTGWFGLFHSSTSSSSSSSTSSKPAAPSSLSSILGSILKTLHQAYPSDPETAYANDRLLGPTYFRLGEWEYDRTGSTVQHFALDALIDYPMLRVDKVVVRVKSNWGGNHTCLYRVKVHGHA